MHNLSVKLYRICVCYVTITLYHVIHSAWYYLWFHVTMVGLECITHGYGGPPVIVTADVNYIALNVILS